MKFAICLLLILLTSTIALCESNVRELEFTSKIFNNTRSLRILVPPDYEKDQNRRYPVFYFNDGLMVFDSKGPGLNIEKIADDLYSKKEIPDMIFVGLDNGACTDKTKNEIADRANEYLPYPDMGFQPGHTYDAVPPQPQGSLYPKFLIGEVMPFINKQFRTLHGPENTYLAGFSYGGVIALYTVAKNPGVFGKLLLESTPLYIGRDRDLLKDVQNAKAWPQAVYIGCGTKETDDAAFLEEGKKDRELLKKTIETNSPKTRFSLVQQKDATHDPSFWKSRLPDALKILFPSATH
jgi:predicted alpha/beta superfamily hydrolase